jgi:hypothetical protein
MESLKVKQIQEAEIEESLERLSHYLDDLFRIPGTKWRFGLDAIIGLIPNVGDTLTMLASIYILIAGVRYGVPKITILRMAMNIAIDYLVGVIPFFGDMFDFFWKTNQRNLNLLKKRATKLDKPPIGDYLFVFGVILGLLLMLLASIVGSIYLLQFLFEKIFSQYYGILT